MPSIGDPPSKTSSRPEVSASVSWRDPIGDTPDEIGLDSLSDNVLMLKLSSLSKSSFNNSTACAQNEPRIYHLADGSIRIKITTFNKFIAVRLGEFLKNAAVLAASSSNSSQSFERFKTLNSFWVSLTVRGRDRLDDLRHRSVFNGFGCTSCPLFFLTLESFLRLTSSQLFLRESTSFSGFFSVSDNISSGKSRTKRTTGWNSGPKISISSSC